MRAWLSLSLASAAPQRLLQRGHLPAQRQQLLVEQVDLGERLVRKWTFLSLSSLVSAGDARILVAAGGGKAAQPLVVGPQRRQRRLQAGKFVLERLAPALLEAQQIGDLGDLPRQAAQRVSLPLASWLT